jgi:hypothetical protein
MSHSTCILSSEHGFRENQITDNATYTMTNKILTAMNNESKAGGIFCDTERAFDCVNHILYVKMEFYGITGKEKTFYTQYLTDINQQILLNNTKSHTFTISKWSQIHYSVPQGSVVSPMLFLLYTNDLLKIINNTSVPILFVDDISILFTRHKTDS